jgi:hypothetical protein
MALESSVRAWCRRGEAADAYRMAIEVAPTDAKRLYLTRLGDTAATE